MEVYITLCIFLFIGLTHTEHTHRQISDKAKQRRRFPFRFPDHINKTELEEEIVQLSNNSKYGVDDDPDFIVAVRGMDTPLCFHVGGQQGEVLRMVQQETMGLFVNAKIIERNDTRKRYLGSVAILRHNVRIFASRRAVVVNRHSFSWDGMTALLLFGHRIIIGRNLMAITFRNKNVTLVVRRHVLQTDLAETDDSYEGEASYNGAGEMVRDQETVTANDDDDDEFVYVGFYIADSRGLGQSCHGLLGQFVHKRATIDGLWFKNGKTKARLRIFSPGYHLPRTVIATMSNRENRGIEQTTTCWLLKRGGEGVVDGNYIDYIVTDLRNKDVIRFQ